MPELRCVFLSTTCPACGGRAQAAAPLKWSPEDNRAALRRKMKGVEDKDWPGQLATLPSLETMRAQHVAEEEDGRKHCLENRALRIRTASNIIAADGI